MDGLTWYQYQDEHHTVCTEHRHDWSGTEIATLQWTALDRDTFQNMFVEVMHELMNGE